MAFEIGRVCIKLAGRDAGRHCVILDLLKNNYVLVDGQTRRRKCSITHLEPLEKVLDIKEKASHEEVVKAFKKAKIPIKEKTKKKTDKK